MAAKIIRFSGESEFRLLTLVVLIVSLSSAIIMNDTAIFIFVPLVLTISRIANVNIPKAVTSIALAANIGSALTPIGNPQNVMIWRVYRVSFWEFTRAMFPFVAIWVILLIIFIWAGSRNKRLEISPMPKIRVDKPLMFISALLLMLNVALAENDYPLIGLYLTIFIFSITNRRVLFSIDILLVAVFALMFINFRELSFLLLRNIKLELSAVKAVILSAGLSQIVSNVPAVIMLSFYSLPWFPLVVGVSIGGTGFVISSMANFIALRISGIGFKEFHRYSLPYFFVTLSITLVILGV